MSKGRYTLIDLFAGAGGLCEGFVQCGYDVIAHVEMNKMACKTLETREVYHYLKAHNRLETYREYERGLIDRTELLSRVPSNVCNSVIEKEMSKDTIKSIFERVDKLMKEKKVTHIDAIIGGPPCQAYSLVGRAQSKHMNHNMSDDSRNYLYKMYARFLARYKPLMFVFENVMGINSARSGQVIKDLKISFSEVGYEMDARLQCATDFGVLQNRKRVIIIGWKKGTKCEYPGFDKVSFESALVNDVLNDLPALERGTENNNYKHTYELTSEYLRETEIRKENDVLTEHVCRSNIQRDVDIYRMEILAWQKHQRIKYDDLPDELKTHKNRTSFVDRYKVIEGNDAYCHTILAHLSKDGHYFIHPDINQCRSLSVREAARLQTFPDDYYFEGGRTAAFVQIGNAVPPLMAKGIAKALKIQLRKAGGRNE